MSVETMHAGEPRTDVSLVRRLIAGQFPQWAGLPVEPFPSSGTVNAVYRLGDTMSVRLPRLERGAKDVETEDRWLRWLAPRLPVAVPAVLGKGVPAEGFPWNWSVHRWIDGDHPVAGRLTEPDLLARDLAGFVSALRRIDPAEGPAAYRGGPLNAEDEETRSALEQLRLRGTIDTDAATAAWEEALSAPRWSGPPVWLHADLMPANLLLRNGRLSAVIDFETMGVGDPASDLIPAWNLLPPGARDTFRTALAADDGTWARGRGWALSMALVQLPYYEDTNPVLATNARHVIDAVLADHRAG
ncbi:aminoglycoside phosphotransferase family protein [Streptomyces sp. NPDC047108]|uniref:aminoglycoside phosphotransferase family protein n=1 Tax=Streptomyces sp. NPDC047108 TaxID=3155025 RepID=UPI0033C7DC5C